MHSTGTGQPVETQDVFFWRLAGRSAPTGLAISFEYYPYIQMWQHMLLCGVRPKPVAHLYHLLQWEVAKVKQLMNSNVTLTVL